MGGSSSQGYDAAYNARIASIAEAQQAIAQENMKFWRSDYKPMEQEQIQANRALIPAETAYRQEQIGQLTQQLKDTAPIRQALISDALKYQPDSIVDTAVNDALQAFAGKYKMADRTMASRGINPSSGQYLAMNQGQSLDFAKTLGAVKTQARNLADNEKQRRLAQALSTNSSIGGI